MLKKIFQNLMLGLLITEISVNTISCTSYKYDSSVWLITDGGTITDRSFNESSYNGVNDYIKSKKPGYKASYYEPTGNSASNFYTAYKIANITGAKAIVLSGYKHSPFLKEETKYAKYNIILDSDNPPLTSVELNDNLSSKQKKYSSEPGIQEGIYKNLVGVTFESEISAFEAGLISFFDINKINPKHSDPFKFATFGGMDISPINSYMWGLISASKFFNSYLKNTLKPNIKTALDEVKNSFKFEPSQSLQDFILGNSQQEFNNGNISPNNWFSGSFSPGDAKNISNSLIMSDKVDLILPVAGIQINDTLAEAKNDNKNNLKFIGVDTPQASIYNSMYPSLNNPIITSAQKNVDQASKDILTDLIDNKDKNNWLGKTIEAPLAAKTDTWSGIEKPTGIDSLHIDWPKLQENIQKLMQVQVDGESLTRYLTQWFDNNQGNKLADLANNEKNNSFLNALKN